MRSDVNGKISRCIRYFYNISAILKKNTKKKERKKTREGQPAGSVFLSAVEVILKTAMCLFS